MRYSGFVSRRKCRRSVPNISAWLRCRPEAELSALKHRLIGLSDTRFLRFVRVRHAYLLHEINAHWIRNYHNHSLSPQDPGTVSHRHIRVFSMHPIVELVVTCWCSWTPQNSRRYPSEACSRTFQNDAFTLFRLGTLLGRAMVTSTLVSERAAQLKPDYAEVIIT